MKKLLVLVLTLAVAFTMVACGGSNKDTKEKATPKEDVKKIERSVDAVAAELGLGDGEESFYGMIGATAGKKYNEGKVEIYKFDVNGESYKKFKTTKTFSGAPVTLNDGMMLMFTGEQDNEMIKKFQALKFK